MDPLSLSASIAGLASLAITIVDLSYKYGSGVLGAPKAQKDFLRELEAIGHPLRQLEKLVAKSDPISPQYPQASADLASTVTECQNDMEDLRRKLEKMQSGGKVKATLSRLKWPLAEDETLKAVQRLERYRSLFQNSLSVDTWNLLSLTYSELQNIREPSEFQESRQILDWLSSFTGPVQPKHHDLVRERIANSGKWLLESPDFIRFTQGDDDFKSLWCYGLPGAGKTYLSSTVIDHIAAGFGNTRTAVAHWYFDCLGGGAQHPVALCGTLLKHFAAYFPQLPSEIRAFHDSFTGDKKRVPGEFDLLHVLLSLLSQLESPFVVIDALDECPEKHLAKVLDILSHLQQSKARVFITSRPHIETPSEGSNRWREIKIQAHSDDLRLLVEHKLQGKSTKALKRIMTEELKEEIIHAITAKAQEMFLWASLQLDEVLKGITKKKILKTLQKMPTSIHQVFGNTMSRITDDFAIRTLLWLTHAKEPLGFSALAHGLSIEFNDNDSDESDDEAAAEDIDTDNMPAIEALVEACFGLVSMDGNKNLRLAHFSIQEYLEVTPAVFGHFNELHISRTCLAYLSLSMFESGYQDSERKFAHRLQDYPLFSYAARNWHSHTLDLQKAQWHQLNDDAWKLYSNPGLFSSYSQAFYSRSEFRPFAGDQSPTFNFQRGHTPLHNAVELRLPYIVSRLLESGSDPSSQTDDGTTPLHLAVRDNSKDLVEILFDAAANLSLSAVAWQFSAESDSCFCEKLRPRLVSHYPASLAIELGHAHSKEILAYGAPLSLEAAGDALETAAKVQDYETVAKLLAKYPDIDHRHPSLLQALRNLKRHKGNPDDLIRLFLQARPLLDDEEGVLTDILPQVVSFTPELVTSLQSKGVDVNSQVRKEALEKAINENDVHTFRLLIEAGVDTPDQEIFRRVVRLGMTDLVSLMLDRGCDPNHCDNWNTPVLLAVKGNHMKTLEVLLSRGGDTEVVDRAGFTPLGAIGFDGNFGIAKILLDHGSNPNADSFNGTPMMRASIHGHERFISLLLDHGADINFLSQSEYETALGEACIFHQTSLCRLLLSRGADPNLGKNRTPLITAANKGDIPIIKALLENGANPLARTCEDEYALEVAVAGGNEDAVRLLLQNGADLQARDGRYSSILHAAVVSGNHDMAGIVLDLGAKLMEDCEKRDGILHYFHGGPQLCQLLISHGADVNAPGKHGSPLQAAIGARLQEDVIFKVIEVLIGAGADVNAGGGRYGFPLQAASRLGLEKVVSLLVEHGASPHSEGGRYGTALQAAAYKGNEFVIDTLLQHGADLNHQGGVYGTALQASAYKGHEAAVRLLLERGADVRMRGGRYHNPLKAAKEEINEKRKVVDRILIKHGAVDDSEPRKTLGKKKEDETWRRGDSPSEDEDIEFEHNND